MKALPVTREGWIDYYMNRYHTTKSAQALHLALWITLLIEIDVC